MMTWQEFMADYIAEHEKDCDRGYQPIIGKENEPSFCHNCKKLGRSVAGDQHHWSDYRKDFKLTIREFRDKVSKSFVFYKV